MRQIFKKFFFVIFIISLVINSIKISYAYPSGGIIYNSTDPAIQTIALGVNPEGHLNTYAGSIVSNAGATGIAHKMSSGSWKDATSPGCLCEGWGVSGTVLSPSGSTEAILGYADVSVGGVSNLEVKTFTVDTLSITSTVWIKDSLGNPILEVTHKYGRSAQAPNVLFQGTVTITNISGKTVTDVRYNRSMDWDMPSSSPGWTSGYEFNEYVSHYGVAESITKTTTPKVINAGDNGFMLPNPSYPGWLHGSGLNTNFIQMGPWDHGSTFSFALGDLACGASSNFMIYYGAADTKAAILNALYLEGLTDATYTINYGVYSIGENRDKALPFVFGFKGLSGVALPPTLPTKIAALPGQSKTDATIIHTYAPLVLSSITSTSGPVTISTKYIYQAIFKYQQNKQWFGDILRYKLLDNGDFSTDVPLSAATKLYSKLTSSSIDSNYTSDVIGGRSIWTVGKDDNPSCAMTTGLTNDSTYNNFSIANKSLLVKLLFNCAAVTDAEVSNVINFVRGRDVFWEGLRTTIDARPSILGDTFHSELVLVGPPHEDSSSSAAPTTEAYYRYSKGYNAFVTANQTRRKQFYVGANDGMLHAFDENLNERWAFIPPSVLNKLRDMMGTVGYAAGAGRSNSAYNVDGPITIKDIYIEAEKKWKTILMGGLGYGGKSYYVLDITDPDKPLHLFTFNHDLSRKLVEFWNADGTKKTWNYSCFNTNWWTCTDASHTTRTQITNTISGSPAGIRSPGNFDYAFLGDAWSKPVITLFPLKRWHPDYKQSWVAVFGAGYGNGDATFTSGTSTDYGRYIYVVDFEPDFTTDGADRFHTTPNGGASVGKLAIPGDSTSNIPFGIASPLTAITSSGTSLANYYGSMVYFTDLQGQLWKLNLSKNSLDAADDIYQTNRLFRTESTISKDRQGFNQLASTVVSSNKVFHYFGTGDQVYPQKRDATNNNRIYGIRDLDFPAYGNALSGDLNVTSNSSLIKNVDELINNTTDLTACSSSDWYTNLYSRTTFLGGSASSDYQKIIGRGRLYQSTLSFSAYRPEDASCAIYGTSQLIQFNTETCSSVVSTLGSGLAVSPITDSKGNVYIGISNLKPGTAVTSGRDNIYKSTTPGVNQKIKIKSWLERRN